MTILTQVVSLVFILARITDCNAFVRCNLLEVRLRTHRSCHSVSFACRASSQSATGARTAARVARRTLFGRYVGVETSWTGGKTAAVGFEEETRSAGGSIQTLFGGVYAGIALRTAWLAQVQDAGIDELADWTGCGTCVGVKVFVESGDGGCGGKVGIGGSGSNVSTRLAAVEPRIGTNCTSRMTLSTCFVKIFFVKVRKTILDTFRVFKIKLNTRVCKSTCSAGFGII